MSRKNQLQIVMDMAWRPEFFVEGPDGPELVVDMSNKVAIYIITGGGFEYEYLKTYGGQAINLKRRRNAYITDYNNWIKAGRPASGPAMKHPKLFRAFDKHGIENFKMIVCIVGIPKEWLNWAEEYLIRILDAYQNGPNCNAGGGPCGMIAIESYEKLLNNEEWRKNVAEAQREKSAEWKRNVARAGLESLEAARAAGRTNGWTRVRNLKTGHRYRSVAGAARMTGTTTATIFNHISGRTAHHVQWEAMTEEEIEACTDWADVEDFIQQRRSLVPVVQLSTGQSFPTVSAAAEATGVAPRTINKHANGAKIRGERDWAYREEEDALWARANGHSPVGWEHLKVERPETTWSTRAQNILDTRTGEIYASRKAAADATGVCPRTVGRDVGRPEETNPRFRAVDAGLKIERPRASRDGWIRDRDGTEYENMEAAAKALGLKKSSIKVYLWKGRLQWMDKTPDLLRYRQRTPIHEIEVRAFP